MAELDFSGPFDHWPAPTGGQEHSTAADHPSETVGAGFRLNFQPRRGKENFGGFRPLAQLPWECVPFAFRRNSFPLNGLARVDLSAWTNVAGRWGYALSAIVKE